MTSNDKLTVCLFTLKGKGPEDDNKNKQYVLRQLDDMRYFVQSAIECQEGIPSRMELESALKSSDIVTVLGGIGGPFSEQLTERLSEIFNEKIVVNERLSYLTDNNGGQTLSHAKLITYQGRGEEVPLVYVQGMVLLVSEPDALKLSFDKIAAPLLERFNNTGRDYRRKIVLRAALDDACCDDARAEGVKVFRKMRGTTFELKLISRDWTKLLDYERKFINRHKEDLLNVFQCDDIIQRVYAQINFEHVKIAVGVVEECFKRYGPENVCICFNGGKDCTVLLHMAVGVLKKRYNRYTEKYSCLYIESPDPFPALTEFVEQCAQYYNLDVARMNGDPKEALGTYLESKPNMVACLMGTRRTDPYSQNLDTFQMTDAGWPQVMRVSPLLDWHYSDIWDYLLHLKVPYCDLYSYGFTSIGGYTNTLRNKDLLIDEASGTYLPAFKLLDASKERMGRTS